MCSTKIDSISRSARKTYHSERQWVVIFSLMWFLLLINPFSLLLPDKIFSDNVGDTINTSINQENILDIVYSLLIRAVIRWA